MMYEYNGSLTKDNPDDDEMAGAAAKAVAVAVVSFGRQRRAVLGVSYRQMGGSAVLAQHDATRRC